MGEKIAQLCKLYKIDTVICTYVMHSKLLEFVPDYILKIIDMDDSSCVVNIITGKSGKFDLIYRVDGEDDVVLTVNIESF